MATKKQQQQMAKADEQNKQLVEASAFEGMEAEGFEEADADSYAIPFLAVLQSGSPQCKRSDGQYIQGAQEGMIMNTVTSELIDGDDGVEVIPVHYQRVYTKWVPKDEGGGFLGEFPIDTPEADRAEREGSKLVLPDGNHLVDTRKHYCIMKKADGSFEPVLITMSSTQIKKSRNIMTRLRNLKLRRSDGKMFTPPSFANVLKLVTVPEQNDQGSWYGWKPDFSSLRQLNLSDQTEAELFEAAKDFREAIRSGKVEEQKPEPAPSADEDDVGY